MMLSERLQTNDLRKCKSLIKDNKKELIKEIYQELEEKDAKNYQINLGIMTGTISASLVSAIVLESMLSSNASSQQFLFNSIYDVGCLMAGLSGFVIYRNIARHLINYFRARAEYKEMASLADRIPDFMLGSDTNDIPMIHPLSAQFSVTDNYLRELLDLKDAIEVFGCERLWEESELLNNLMAEYIQTKKSGDLTQADLDHFDMSINEIKVLLESKIYNGPSLKRNRPNND